MGRFRLAHLAKADLAEIHCYIARDKPHAADRQIARFFEKFKMLAAQPMMGELRPELGPDVRSFAAGSYVIFYRPMVGGVEIARVVSGFRDIAALFG